MIGIAQAVANISRLTLKACKIAASSRDFVRRLELLLHLRSAGVACLEVLAHTLRPLLDGGASGARGVARTRHLPSSSTNSSSSDEGEVLELLL